MQIWCNAFCLLMFSGQFYEKWVSVRERNIKLLLETVTYIATTETVTCIITIEIVMCIMHCRKYYLHDCNRDSHVHNFNKNCHTHICCRNFHLHKCCRNFSLHNCNRNTHLRICNKHWHLHNYYSIVLTETTICRIDYKNFHSQKWCQSEILLVIIKKN